jgi:hypothetical protein
MVTRGMSDALPPARRAAWPRLKRGGLRIKLRDDHDNTSDTTTQPHRHTNTHAHAYLFDGLAQAANLVTELHI